MQYQTVSNAYYAVLGSLQHELLGFLYSLHRIYIFLPLCLSKISSIVAYLGHLTSILSLCALKTLKYHNFLFIYHIEIK